MPSAPQLSDASVDAAADGSSLEAAVEAGPAEPPPASRCTPRASANDPSTPHALPLVPLDRRLEPAFANRPLGPVAFNGAQRLWLFRSEFREVATEGNAGGDLPLAAYDSSSVRDLTAAPPTRLDFSVGSRPLVARRGDESVAPGALPNVSLEPLSFVANINAELGGTVFLYKLTDGASPETWLADIAAGATEANRHAAALFSGDDKDSTEAALRGPRYLTLYRCDWSARTCTAARVANGSENRASAYEYYTRDAGGTWSWTNDRSRATPVITGAHPDLTIHYNEYLGRYLAVHLEAQPFENTIVLQTSAAPEGPFTPFATVEVLNAPLNFIRLVRAQPALSDPCGKRVALSYYEPRTLVEIYPASGTTVLAYVELP